MNRVVQFPCRRCRTLLYVEQGPNCPDDLFQSLLTKVTCSDLGPTCFPKCMGRMIRNDTKELLRERQRRGEEMP